MPKINLQDAKDDFDSKWVDDLETGCWIWTGNVSPQGYGRFYYRGESFGAHRAAYIIYRGEIPEGVYICHTCDVTWCVNPYHLFEGTQLDNMSDAAAKGRCRGRGPRKEAAADLVSQVKLSGLPTWKAAKEFNLSYETVYSIRTAGYRKNGKFLLSDLQTVC